jgi:hypothetical protein
MFELLLFLAWVVVVAFVWWLIAVVGYLRSIADAQEQLVLMAREEAYDRHRALADSEPTVAFGVDPDWGHPVFPS